MGENLLARRKLPICEEHERDAAKFGYYEALHEETLRACDTSLNDEDY